MIFLGIAIITAAACVIGTIGWLAVELIIGGK